MTAYPGDNTAKRLTRFLLWSRVKEAMGPRWHDARFLVLSGPRADDTTLLKLMGVDPERIVMVDINPDHVQSAHKIHPDVESVQGDVFDLVLNRQNSFDMIYLDYCGTACTGTLGKTADITKLGLTMDGLFATTFYSSREADEQIWDLLEEAREYYGDPALHSDSPAGDPAIYRVAAITEAMQNEFDFPPAPTHAWYYTNTHSKPLMVMLWQPLAYDPRSVHLSYVTFPLMSELKQVAQLVGWDIAGYIYALPRSQVAAHKAAQTRQHKGTFRSRAAG